MDMGTYKETIDIIAVDIFEINSIDELKQYFLEWHALLDFYKP